MHDRQLYAKILGLTAPWQVSSVHLDMESLSVEVVVEHSGSSPLECPECGAACPGYDHRRRRWRHLDTCQYRTILVCDVPRVACPEHGVHQVRVPWAEPDSRFTALFEALVIDWLLESSFAAVGRQLGLSWAQLDTIQRRAVRRGLARRQQQPLRVIGIDETSFQKRHEYVTVVFDLASPSPRVLFVADHRKKAALDAFYAGYSASELARLEHVSMDMWAPYVASTMEHVPDAREKICFDRFHVAQLFGKAVDQVRRQETKELTRLGDRRLRGTRYLWLKGADRLQVRQKRSLDELRSSCAKTARAWQIKETARQLWSYRSRAWAAKNWKQLLGWASRSRLQPMVRVARTLRRYLWGVLNAVTAGVTNARAEALNAKIQWIKRKACGYRNRERFRNAIYFHCGGLELYPELV